MPASDANLNSQIQLTTDQAAIRANTDAKISAQQIEVIVNMAQVDSQEIIQLAQARIATQGQIAFSQYGYYLTTSFQQYAAALNMAQIRAGATRAVAGSDVDNIEATARYQVDQIAGSARAQQQELLNLSRIRAETTAATTATQAKLAGDQALLDAYRTIRVSTIQATTSITAARVDAADSLALANMQASEIIQTSAIQVAEMVALADLRVSEILAASAIRVLEQAALTTLHIFQTEQTALIHESQILAEAQQAMRGATEAATIRANEAVLEAQIRADARIAVGGIEAAFRIYAASRHAAGVIYKADQEYATAVYAADSSSQLSHYRADLNYAGTVFTADMGLMGTMYAADGDQVRRIAAAESEAEAKAYSADMDFAGVVAKDASLTEMLTIRINHLMGRYNQILAIYKGALVPRPLPGKRPSSELTQAEMYTPRQIRMTLNRKVQEVNAWAAGEKRRLGDNVTGRGFGFANGHVRFTLADIEARRIERIADAAIQAQVELMAKNQGALVDAQVLFSKLFLDEQQVYVAYDELVIRRMTSYLETLTTVVAGL